MKLDKSVKILPWPFGKVFKGLTFYKNIYLQKEIYYDILGAKPKPESVGILLHEQTHRRRINRPIVHGIKYLLFPKTRYKEEIAANETQLKYLKKHGGTFDFQRRAKQLSGLPYICCISYKKALKDLRSIWNES